MKILVGHDISSDTYKVASYLMNGMNKRTEGIFGILSMGFSIMFLVHEVWIRYY